MQVGPGRAAGPFFEPEDAKRRPNIKEILHRGAGGSRILKKENWSTIERAIHPRKKSMKHQNLSGEGTEKNPGS